LGARRYVRLDKRQCTVQLTLFADGIPRVKPLVIFRGTGKRIALRERLKYDKRVGVRFQKKAWCDEKVMTDWVRNFWKPNVHSEMLLTLWPLVELSLTSITVSSCCKETVGL